MVQEIYGIDFLSRIPKSCYRYPYSIVILYYKIIQILPLKEKRNPTIKIDDVG